MARQTLTPLHRQYRNLESGRALMYAAVVIAAFLVLWRMTPRPLSAVLGTDRFVSASVQAIQWEVRDGAPVAHTWTLTADSPEDGEAVRELLDSTRYRPDLRNLWLLQSDTRSYSHGDTTLYAVLTGEDGEDRDFGFYKPSLVETGGKIYHPVDRRLLDRLAAYVMEYGEEQGD